MARSAPKRVLPLGWTRQQHKTPSGRCYYVYRGPAQERTYSYRAACEVACGKRSVGRGSVRKTLSKQSHYDGKPRHRAWLDLKEWPSLSHKGIKVPQSTAVAAGADLPGWMTTRVQLADTGQQIVVYISPGGKLVHNRSTALRLTGQLRMSQSERSRVRAEREQQQAHEASMDVSIDMFGKAVDLQSVANKRYEECMSEDVRPVHLGNWPAGAYTAHLAQLFKPQQEGGAVDGSVAVVDLFCGAGGLSLGLSSVGFSVFGVDSSTACVDTYRANRCGGRSLVQKLCTADAPRWSDAAKAAGLHGDLPAALRTASLVLVGGPPCQPYAHMGTHGGTVDDRDGLRTFVAMTRAMMPDMIMIENVPDMLKPKYDEQVQPLLRELQDLGYELYAGLYKCANYGVPQRRERTIIVGARRRAFETGEGDASDGASDAILRFKKALMCERMSVGPSPTCADAIDVITYPDFWTTDDAPQPARMSLETYNAREKRAALRLSSTTGLLFATHTAPTTLSSSLSNNCYMRMLALPASVPSDSMKVRHARAIDVEQLALLHSFPPKFDVRGAYSYKALQIANAVPPRFAYSLARGLLAACETLPCRSKGKAARSLRALKIALAQA